MAITLQGQGRNYKRLSATAVDASGANSSSAFSVSTFTFGDFQFVWASHDDTSTFELQVSNDGGTSWDTISGTSTTTSGATGSSGFRLDPMPGGLIRMTVTETDGNASATITPYLVGKWGR